MTDISQSAIVTASSYDTTGRCAPNLCNPQHVTDAQSQSGINGVDASRWKSEIEVMSAMTTVCIPQWLDFQFANPTSNYLDVANILYGELGSAFQGNNPTCPELSVTYGGNLGYTPLKLGQDFNCVIDTNARNGGDVARQDNITFVATSSLLTGNVQRLRMQWTLAPNGLFNPLTCSMDVEEVFIQQHSKGNTQSGSNSDSSSSSTTPSGPSAGIIAAIIVLSLVALFIGAILLVRQRNLKRRKQAALALRDRNAADGNF